MNDKLFFLVFRNVYLKKKILNSISGQYIDFVKPHVSNRKPYEQIQSLKWMLEKRLYNIIKDKVISKSIIIIDNLSIDCLIKTCTNFETFKILFDHKRFSIESVDLIKRSIELDSVFALDAFLKLYQEDQQKEQISDGNNNNSDVGNDSEDIINFKLNQKENTNIWMMNLALELSNLHVAEYILNNCKLPLPEKPGLLYRGATFLSKFDNASKPDSVLRFIVEKMGVNLELVVQSTKSTSMLPSLFGITRIRSLQYRLAFLKNKFLKNVGHSKYYYDHLNDREKVRFSLDFSIYALLFKYQKKGKQFYNKFIDYINEHQQNQTLTVERIYQDHQSNCPLLYISYYFQQNQLDKIEPLLVDSENMIMLYRLSIKNFSFEGLNLFIKYFTKVGVLNCSTQAIPLSSMKDISVKSDKQVLDFLIYVSDISEIPVPWLSIFQIFQQCYPVELFNKVKSIHIKKHNKTFGQFIQDYCNNQFFDILKSFFIISEYKNNQIDTDYIDLFFQYFTEAYRNHHKLYFQNIFNEKIQDFKESIRILEYLIDIHCNGNKKIFSSFLIFFDIVYDNFFPPTFLSLESPSSVPHSQEPTLPISNPIEHSVKYYNQLKSSPKIQSFISNHRLEIFCSTEYKSLENIYFLNYIELLLFNKPITLLPTSMPEANYRSTLNDLYKIRETNNNNSGNSNNNSGDNYSINLELLVLIFKNIYELKEDQFSVLYSDLSNILNSSTSSRPTSTDTLFNQRLGQLIIYLFSNQYFKLFDFRFIFKWIDYLVNILGFNEDQILIIVNSIYNSFNLLYNKSINNNNNKSNDSNNQASYGLINSKASEHANKARIAIKEGKTEGDGYYDDNNEFVPTYSERNNQQESKQELESNKQEEELEQQKEEEKEEELEQQQKEEEKKEKEELKQQTELEQQDGPQQDDNYLPTLSEIFSIQENKNNNDEQWGQNKVVVSSNILMLKGFLSILTRKLISLNYYNIFKYLYDAGLYQSSNVKDPFSEYTSVRKSKNEIQVRSTGDLNLKLVFGNFENLESDIEAFKSNMQATSHFGSPPPFTFYPFSLSYEMLLSNARVEQFDKVYKLLYSKMVSPSKLLLDLVMKNRFDLFLFYSENMASFSTGLEDKVISYIVNNGECYYFELLLKNFKHVFKKEFIEDSIKNGTEIKAYNHQDFINNRIKNALELRSPSQIFKNSLIGGHTQIAKLVLQYFDELKDDFKVNKKLTNSLIENGRLNSIKFLFEVNLLIDLDYLLKSNSLTTSLGVWKIEISELFVSLINNIILKQQNQQQFNKNNNIDKMKIDSNKNSTIKKSITGRISKKRNSLILNSLSTMIIPPGQSDSNGSESTIQQPLKRQRIRINDSFKF